ncbi:PQ loop repeat family protein [Histomonas meleagridis]|uniref:PQ loop repeat family protein n=1 Tax=Histomonas meleagridis TaxID=135588 RepID=UPI00355AB6D1|nr:PQ loop repeat family protein [Histomonas meleagridis]KAH0806116.1 PQ loop repeat family protein [Histomonas meleagridis]
MSPCPEGAIGWIADAFGECIVNARDRWSFGIGMVSNVIWVVSSVPQIYQTCKVKKVDGQSPFLFSFLTLGNVLNLVGIIITHGLLTQILTQILYLLMDGIMFIQFLYYKYIKNKCCPDIEESTSIRLHSEESSSSSVLFSGVLAQSASSAVDWSAPYKGTLLLGEIFGWVGALIYIISRVPQNITNCKTKKVSLSPYYVILAILGNATYFASILIKSTEANYLWQQCPFIVGALAPMLCDILTIIQMIIYGRGFADKVEKPEELHADENPESSSEDVSEDKNIPEI